MLHVPNQFYCSYLCCIAQGRQGKSGKYTPSCCHRHFCHETWHNVNAAGMKTIWMRCCIFFIYSNYSACVALPKVDEASHISIPSVALLGIFAKKLKWMWCCIFLTNSIAPICVALPKVDKASLVSTLTVAVAGIFAMKLSIMLMPLEWRQYNCDVAFSSAIQITLLVVHCPR